MTKAVIPSWCLHCFLFPSLTTKEELLLSGDLRESFKLQEVFQAVPSPSRKTEPAGRIPTTPQSHLLTHKAKICSAIISVRQHQTPWRRMLHFQHLQSQLGVLCSGNLSLPALLSTSGPAEKALLSLTEQGSCLM